MTNIIEQVARGAKNTLPGMAPANEKSREQDARGADLIKQLALGGAALGGGTGLAVILANYLKSMRDENEVDDASRINDDTLYVPMPKSAAVNRWVAPGVAATGGILAAGGAYALTQKVYNYLQKKHREKLLDEAQNEALTAADMEVSKSAAELTFADLVTAFPVAVPMLAAIASGGVAYAALNKTFPTVTTPKSKFPKRIRAVTQTGDVEPLPLGSAARDTMKQASFSDDDCQHSAVEFLMMFVDTLGGVQKRATLTSELLGRVSASGMTEPKSVLLELGLPALCETIKGASVDDGLSKLAAAAVISRDATLGPIAHHLAAAEFVDILPGIASICSSMDYDQLDKMAGLGVLLHESYFRPAALSKQATAVPALPPALLQQLMATVQAQGQRPQHAGRGAGLTEDTDAALTSDISGSMTEDAEGDQDTNVDAGSESQGGDDVIDAFIDDPAKGG